MIRPRTQHREGEQIWAVITAAASGDTATLRRLVENDPSLSREGYFYTPPIHFAVREGHRLVVEILLAAGADSEWNGYYGASLIDMAKERGHDDIAALLEKASNERGRAAPAETGADHPIHAAAESGDVRRVRELLDAHPTLIDRADHAGGTPLHRAVIGRAREVVNLLLDRGANIHAIHGTADPRAAELGCGGVFTAVVTRGKRDLLKRLLDAGIRVPPFVTGCQSYLLEQLDMLQTLLEHGMNPDTSNWQMQTMLHMLCRSGKPDDGSVERARLLLDAGANISARDDDLCSTPLGWAARNDRPDMVEFLLARGAPLNLPDDKPWATPLAWATRRGHTRIVELLRAAGGHYLPGVYSRRHEPASAWTDARICGLRRKMSQEILAQLGPLAALAGVWEGDKGDDIAPADDRTMIERNQYRERMTFEPIKPVQNHEQTLYGLRYATVAWRIGDTDAFHEELGYWLWDPSAGHVMRCFMVPRGVTVIAGGSATADATTFSLAADLGSPTYGICSNKFLDEHFKDVIVHLLKWVRLPIAHCPSNISQPASIITH